jgi:hypothetical protein
VLLRPQAAKWVADSRTQLIDQAAGPWQSAAAPGVPAGPSPDALQLQVSASPLKRRRML